MRPGPPGSSPVRHPTPTGSDRGLWQTARRSLRPLVVALAAVAYFATHWNDNNPGTQLGGAPSEGSVTNSGTPSLDDTRLPGILQVVLHIGHVEIQDDQVRLQDVQAVPVLQVLEQRAVGQNPGVHDFDRWESSVAQPPFQLPGKHDVIRGSKTKSEGIAQQQDSKRRLPAWARRLRASAGQTSWSATRDCRSPAASRDARSSSARRARGRASTWRPATRRIRMFATRKPVSTNPRSVNASATTNSARTSNGVDRATAGRCADSREGSVMQWRERVSDSPTLDRRGGYARTDRSVADGSRPAGRPAGAETAATASTHSNGRRGRTHRAAARWPSCGLCSVLPKSVRQIVGDRLRVVTQDRLALPGVRQQHGGRLAIVMS